MLNPDCHTTRQMMIIAGGEPDRAVL